MEYLSIPHYRGLKEKYDEQKHGDGIFFTTDTHEIIANNATYGETIDTWSIADGVLTLTMTSGKTLKITFDEATESAKGFLSAEDKKKINALEGNFNKKVDKVPGKSLVDDTEIDKLSNFPNKADLDSAIADAKKAGTDTQTNLTAHIENKENPHEVTKVQVGLGNVTNDAQVKRSEMGTANGVATLGEDGLVPSSQLPSSVNGILEFDSKDNFPTTGETGKIYVAKDSNLTYRWSGTQYIEISTSLTLGETSSTAYAGDKGKDVADKLAKIRNTPLSHIKDTDTFSATAEKVSLNYDCYVGDQYGAEATSHSVDIPIASETQAGIVTAEDKKAITNFDTTYAKKADVDNLKTSLSAVYTYKGSVNTYDDLPTEVAIGDTYNVVAAHGSIPAGTNYAWNGESWDALGGSVDLSTYYTKSETDKAISGAVSKVSEDVSTLKKSVAQNTSALNVLNGTEETAGSLANTLKITKDYTDTQLTGYVAKVEGSSLISGEKLALIDTNAANIATLQAKVEANEAALAKLNGDASTSGSVINTVNSEVNSAVNSAINSALEWKELN